MTDASQPFRPRLGPVDQAVANIEGQTSSARQRLNRFAIGEAAFRGGGAALFGMAALVLLAFSLPARGFAIAAWTILAVVAAVSIVRIRRAAQAWVPRAAAALVIDHRAGLEDRLATLVSVSPAARRSRLWEFLLHENLRLMPHWEPRGLEPRSMPRGSWFFALSLVVALTTIAGRAWHSRSSTSPAGGEEAALTNQPPGAQPESPDGQQASSSSVWGALPWELQRAILGARASQGAAGSIADDSPAVKGDATRRSAAGERMAANARSEPSSSDLDRSTIRKDSPNQPLPPPNPNRPSGKGQPSELAARGEAPKTLQALTPRVAKTDAEKAHDGNSGGGGPGAGTGGSKDGLFGERQAAAKGSGSFSLDLDALQSGQPTNGGDEEVVDRRRTHLGDDQRLDDSVRRAQVPAEYEKIVQRIFNRSEAMERGEPSR